MHTCYSDYSGGQKYMNLYDTKLINCSKCGSWIGEISHDAQVIRAKCGKCANPLPEGDDILYLINTIRNDKREILVEIK